MIMITILDSTMKIQMSIENKIMIADIAMLKNIWMTLTKKKKKGSKLKLKDQTKRKLLLFRVEIKASLNLVAKVKLLK